MDVYWCVDVFEFVGTVILVTASGALAPGPLFFATVSHGARTGARSGLVFSVAHTVIEFSLILLLAVGLLSVTNEPAVKTVIGISGGTVLILFGLFQIRNSVVSPIREKTSEKSPSRHLFLIGLAFTGLNPYFVLWWLTVGAQLIIISLEFASFWGVLFMYACHVWMDYVWLTGIAHLSKKGMSIMGVTWYKVVLGVFGVILVYFGFTFLRPALGF